MPAPNCCLEIKGPTGPGVYQIRNKLTLEYILFGIGKDCQKRMQSLYPKPYGRGTPKKLLASALNSSTIDPQQTIQWNKNKKY